MTISDTVIQNIIRNLLLAGANYRVEVVNMLDTHFDKFAVDFYKKLLVAKWNDEFITHDWYEEVLLHEILPVNEIAINSGTDTKTINNDYHDERKYIEIDKSRENYDALYKLIPNLVDDEYDFGLTLKITMRRVGVDLTIGESVVVVNTLAAKRAQLRGRIWSSVEIRVKRPLMLTLCKLYSVPQDYYSTTDNSVQRDRHEVDFYLRGGGQRYRCEVKLMGKGNPESADAVYPRHSNIFVADKLSELKKDQLNSAEVHWIDLSAENGYRKFGQILNFLNIPYEEPPDDIDDLLDEVLKDIFE